MQQKSIISVAVCATLLLLATADGLDGNRQSGVTLSCWANPVVPENFRVGYYFSSRVEKNVRSTSKSHIGRDDIDFDPNRKTAVLVHGYQSNSQSDNMKALRDALLAWQDMNVIAVDWRNGSSGFIYPQAAANTVRAASGLKGLLMKLARSTKKPFNQWNTVHLIGHSLGAHVVGQIGAELKKENLIVDRITGLDPAAPCFDDPKVRLRLKKSNARFVDVIHTDAAEGNSRKFGLRDALGHADFYVNGGSNQPGCPPSAGALTDGVCDHTRSIEIFISSIIQATTNACQYWAHPWSVGTAEAQTSRIIQQKCDQSNCVELGINAEKYRGRPRSTYYVKTTAQAPYCLK